MTQMMKEVTYFDSEFSRYNVIFMFDEMNYLLCIVMKLLFDI